MASNEKPLLKTVVEGMVQLDPETCGSSIRRNVVVRQTKWKSKKGPIFGRDFDMTVHLTDCSRQITWGHPGGAEKGSAVMLRKLDRAIAELRKMRTAIKDCEKIYDKLPVTHRDGISGVDD